MIFMPPAAPRDGVSDPVRWAAFSCFLVPVVLLWCGTSFAGAVGTALGLAAVTGVCRLLLRRTGSGSRGNGHRTGENTPVD